MTTLTSEELRSALARLGQSRMLRVFARMEDAARHAGPGRPRVARAMMNLGMALKNRMARPVSTEELDRIVSMIDDTAAAIEKS